MLTSLRNFALYAFRKPLPHCNDVFLYRRSRALAFNHTPSVLRGLFRIRDGIPSLSLKVKSLLLGLLFSLEKRDQNLGRGQLVTSAENGTLAVSSEAVVSNCLRLGGLVVFAL